MSLFPIFYFEYCILFFPSFLPLIMPSPCSEYLWSLRILYSIIPVIFYTLLIKVFYTRMFKSRWNRSIHCLHVAKAYAFYFFWILTSGIIWRERLIFIFSLHFQKNFMSFFKFLYIIKTLIWSFLVHILYLRTILVRHLLSIQLNVWH